MRDRILAMNPYLAALVAVGCVTGLCLPLRAYLDAVDVLVFYLIAVTAVSLLADLKASIAAATGAFLAFNFFFTAPHYTFFVANTHDILALVTFVGASILISRLVVRARSRTLEALRHGRQMETLYRLSFALVQTDDLDAMLASIVAGVRDAFDLSICAILLSDDEDVIIGATTDANLDLTADGELRRAVSRLLMDQQARRASATPFPEPSPRNVQPAREYAGPLRDQHVLLVPITTATERRGVLLAARSQASEPFNDDDRRLLETFANQAALAIERGTLAAERARAEILSRTDELRRALLSAVSHDLRTPLTSIKASITTLMQPDIDWDEADRYELMAAIDEEADRLNRIVTNLLDLSRIEAGALQPVRDWYSPEGIVRDALERLERQLAGREIVVEMPERDVLVDVDAVMIAEVLANLLENAAKYSPPGTPIRIVGRIEGLMLAVSVIDRGIGLPAGEEEQIFDMFYRARAGGRTSGAGMGLAICRGFVEAHGGTIRATSNPNGGATFTFTLPLADEHAAMAGQSTPEPVERAL